MKLFKYLGISTSINNAQSLRSRRRSQDFFLRPNNTCPRYAGWMQKVKPFNWEPLTQFIETCITILSSWEIKLCRFEYIQQRQQRCMMVIISLYAKKAELLKVQKKTKQKQGNIVSSPRRSWSSKVRKSNVIFPVSVKFYEFEVQHSDDYRVLK